MEYLLIFSILIFIVIVITVCSNWNDIVARYYDLKDIFEAEEKAKKRKKKKSNKKKSKK